MSHTKRTPEVVAEVLRRLANGESYQSIYESDKAKFPELSALANWCREDERLAIARARATAEGALARIDQAEEMLTAEPRKFTTYDKSGNPTVRYDPADIMWRKARADIKLKVAGLHDPARYGQRAAIDIGNQSGKPFEMSGDTDTKALVLAMSKAMRDEARKTYTEDEQAAGEDLV